MTSRHGSRVAHPTSSPAIAEALHCIRRLVGSLHSSARAIEARTGITNAQLFLLQALEQESGLSIGELAGVAGARQSTASLIVGRLVRAGLVQRQQTAEDRRRVHLTLTARGRRLLQDAPTPTTARLLEALQTLRPRDCRQLVESLTLLDRALGIDDREPGMLFESLGPGKRITRL